MKKHSKNIIYLTVCLFMHTVFLFSQDADFSKVLDAFNSNDFKVIDEALVQIDTSRISTYDKATWFYYNADYNFRKDNHHFAFENIIASKKIFLTLKEEKDVIDCNLLLLGILSHQNNLKINREDILIEIEAYVKSKPKRKEASSIYLQIAIKYFDLNDAKNAIKYFNKAIEPSLSKTDSSIIGRMYINISAAHSILLKNTDSSLYYLKKSAPILIKYKDYQNLSANYNNQGREYIEKKKYNKAIEYFKKSEAISLSKHISKTKLIHFKNLAKVYELQKDYIHANLYLNKYIHLKDSVNDVNQNIAIAGYKEQYDNEKIRAENLEIESKRKRNKNLLIITLIVLFFGSITSVLVYKNNKKKQKIIEAEKLFEQQRIVSLLKEHELIAIDAMIVGQEKERQIIASDLHDDIGALMATLQFNFENLYKYRDSHDAERLFIQTKGLIKEAYKKIRLIANVKNSGVIAKQGLLKAIINNAEKISKLNNIHIEVKEHGLINRLENQLELIIFRIIQELVTNIVKHAQATETVIHLTNHEYFLNIMVEDNGQGFDINKITNSDGMGIKSIETRVESIGGTFVIESILEKGTAIIIDIPI